ncbi:MAG TPA: hypothetical protein VFO38_05005 [Candidatus Saccharimonadales bacterium]|nr:hypothetical protein [Candidatus Saccharimonadales bacterium]
MASKTTKLVELVPADMIGTPNTKLLELLHKRLPALLSLQGVTPVAQAEAHAISLLLRDGSLSSGNVLRLILAQSGKEAHLELTDENAEVLNPLIERQRQVWANLLVMARHGQMPEPPVSITDPQADLMRLQTNAEHWWRHQVEVLRRVRELDALPTPTILDLMPSFVTVEMAKEWFRGPYRLGAALYLHQTELRGASQSTDSGTLAALADSLAVAVIMLDASMDVLGRRPKKQDFLRLATIKGWFQAVLRGFLYAALRDPKEPLVAALREDDRTVIDIRLALAFAPVPGTVNWENLAGDTRSKAIRATPPKQLATMLVAAVAGPE